jgi:hypothetical protein
MTLARGLSGCRRLSISGGSIYGFFTSNKWDDFPERFEAVCKKKLLLYAIHQQSLTGMLKNRYSDT